MRPVRSLDETVRPFTLTLSAATVESGEAVLVVLVRLPRSIHVLLTLSLPWASALAASATLTPRPCCDEPKPEIRVRRTPLVTAVALPSSQTREAVTWYQPSSPCS